MALLRNYKSKINLIFFIFTLALAVWIMSSYISNDTTNSKTISLYGNYIVFLFSLISGYLLAWFSIALSENRFAEKIIKISLFPLFIVGILCFTPLIIKSVQIQGSVYAITFGPLVILYALSLLGLLTYSLIILRKGVKVSRGSKQQHLKLLYVSMVIALPFLVITEFILPTVTGWFGLTNVGILVMILPTLGLYYSVVRLKLFNVRLAVVRSIGFIIAVGAISLIYGIISFIVIKFLNFNKNVSLQELFNVVFIIFSSSIFYPLLRFFRRISDRLFYQDSYNPQNLYDELNSLLVSSIDLNEIIEKSQEIVKKYLRVVFVDVEIIYQKKNKPKLSEKFDNFNVDNVLNYFLKNKQDYLVVDEIEESDLHKSNLEKNNISAIFRLYSKTNQRIIGYILISNKKSGNILSKIDIKVLETAANEMTIAIENVFHYEEIANFANTLQSKVDSATYKLRRANEKLQALDESKDDFISMASHQLRTPLTSVKGYLSMVLEGDAGKVSKVQKDMLDQAYFSSQRMTYIISDLLNVSRLKTGKFVIERSKVNLAKLIEEEIAQLTETALNKKIDLIYDKPKNFPDFYLDETKTRQVVMNFMDNALYYTPQDGEVRVELIDKEKTIEFRVTDNGIGVPRKEQVHLFTKFYRAGNARKVRPDGTGLGLYMAKKVIVAEGGSIIFESQEGEGSTFGFEFSKDKISQNSEADS